MDTLWDELSRVNVVSVPKYNAGRNGNVALPFYSETIKRSVDLSLINKILGGQWHGRESETHVLILAEWLQREGKTIKEAHKELDIWLGNGGPQDKETRKGIHYAFGRSFLRAKQRAYAALLHNRQAKSTATTSSDTDNKEAKETSDRDAIARETNEPHAPNQADRSMPDGNTRRNGDAPDASADEEVPKDKKERLHTLAHIKKTYKALGYFWYPWIPDAEVTIINGDGGVGKSYLNCAIAAYRAMGVPLPGDDRVYPPVRSLIINNEDHNDRIVERMSSLPIQVDFESDLIRLWPEEWKPFHATDETQIRRLETIIRENNIQALWLDSLESLLPEVDINKDSEIVPKLRRLVALAKSYKIPMVINHHVNSSNGVKAKQRSRGSKQVVNISRSMLIVEKLTDEADPTARAIAHAKVNYAPEAKTLTFHIVPQPERKAAFAWGCFKETSADELMNQKFTGEAELKEDHLRALEYLVEKGECDWVKLSIISSAFPNIPKPHLSGRILRLLRAKGYVDWREGGEYMATEEGRKLVKAE